MIGRQTEEHGLLRWSGRTFSSAGQYQDGYRIMMRHALEIVRREAVQIADRCAIAEQKEGIAVVLYIQEYRAVEVKRCFTKIRKEIEKQRDLFWDIRCTVCLGSRRHCAEELAFSMREALWLCRDRLCHVQPWRDANAKNWSARSTITWIQYRKNGFRKQRNIWI